MDGQADKQGNKVDRQASRATRGRYMTNECMKWKGVVCAYVSTASWMDNEVRDFRHDKNDTAREKSNPDYARVDAICGVLEGGH